MGLIKYLTLKKYLRSNYGIKCSRSAIITLNQLIELVINETNNRFVNKKVLVGSNINKTINFMLKKH